MIKAAAIQSWVTFVFGLSVLNLQAASYVLSPVFLNADPGRLVNVTEAAPRYVECGEMAQRCFEPKHRELFLCEKSGSAGKTASKEQEKPALFSKENLVAWCIVPYDAKNRTPEERAVMLKELGIKKVAYDWRKRHVPAFEDEILACRKHGIEYFAFWSWHEDIGPLFRKHGIRPQIWRSLVSPPASLSHDKKVAFAGKRMLPFVSKALELGCVFGLYNHGGWGGEPGNMVSVCRWLRKRTHTKKIGIVYNLHHGHGHIGDFAEVLELMKPYLLCLNLNGMNSDGKPKILPVGEGDQDLRLIRIIAKSGYSGPIGILCHDNKVDAKVRLKKNCEGLRKLAAQVKCGSSK